MNDLTVRCQYATKNGRCGLVGRKKSSISKEDMARLMKPIINDLMAKIAPGMVPNSETGLPNDWSTE